MSSRAFLEPNTHDAFSRRIVEASFALQRLESNGSRRSYTCVVCDEAVFPRFGRKRPHFMHAPTCPCDGGPPSDIHNKLVAMIVSHVLAGGHIPCPHGVRLSASFARREQTHRIPGPPRRSLRPDVTLFGVNHGAGNLFVEVTYTHAVPLRKLELLQVNRLPTLEFDIAELYKHHVSDHDLASIVEGRTSCVRWLVPPDAFDCWMPDPGNGELPLSGGYLNREPDSFAVRRKRRRS